MGTYNNWPTFLFILGVTPDFIDILAIFYRNANHFCDITFFNNCVLCFCSFQFISVAQSCLTLCNPMDCSTPPFPAHHQLPELVQTQVHRVGDAIQPSHRLSSPSPPAINLPSIRVFFNESVLHIRWQSIGLSASVLPMNIQDGFPLGWSGWISLQSKGLSRVFSNTTVQKHQFFSDQLSLWSNFHIHTWLLEKP